MVQQKKVGRLILFWSSVFLFFLWLLRTAFLGQLGGTFWAQKVPEEYVILKVFLYRQKEEFAVLWIPKQPRFGFYSKTHPAISVSDWIEDDKCLEPFCSLKITNFNREYFSCHRNEKCFPADVSFLTNPKSIEELKKLNVKYLVIPYDSEEEIFLYERKYDAEARKKLEDFLDTLPWLNKIIVVKNIAVYEVP